MVIYNIVNQMPSRSGYNIFYPNAPRPESFGGVQSLEFLGFVGPVGRRSRSIWHKAFLPVRVDDDA